MDFAKLRQIIFFTALVGISIIFIYMIRPFAYPIFWAAVIASIFYPLYELFLKKFKNRSFSAALTLVSVVVVILVPLFLIATLVISQSLDIFNALDNSRSQINTTIQNITQWIQHNPITSKLNIDNQFWASKFADFTRFAVNFIFNWIKGFTQNSLEFLLQVVIMFYTLFFFIRDGKKMLKFFMHLCPLGDKYEEMLYNKFTSAARATLKGTVVLGIIQGILGGLMFFFAGIQAPFIWGVIMSAFSIIPPLSSAIIWLPASIILMVTGKFWVGLAMLAFGVLVISTIDNLLRPILVGKDTQMHPLFVLFSTLGGIILFGISGFIIGPIIAALFLAFWEMYEHYYKKELAHDDGEM